MKIVTIVGARPQFIKAAPLSRECIDAGVNEILVHTGQHYDNEMSAIFFKELGIPSPKYNLKVGSGRHGVMTGRMLEKIEHVLYQELPDIVLVYGDTNSTLAASLAAAKLHIPIAHVEAGLRSWNRVMPEETNRVLTDHVSTELFCSSDTGKANLAKEGITSGVHVVGDVMADANRLAMNIVGKNQKKYLENIPKEFFGTGFGLLTLHRAENTDDWNRLRNIVNEINELDLPIVFPVHPRTRKALGEAQLQLRNHVLQVQPMGYLEMMAILSKSKAVLTDSGGLQKEAYWANVPCITLRDETEWIETVEEGWNVIYGQAGVPLKSIVQNLRLGKSESSSYGDGYTADRIVEVLLKYA